MNKILLTMSLFSLIAISSNAQVVRTLPHNIPSSAIKKPTLANPQISSPSAGSVISGPFVIVGKGMPNATITLHVIPVSKNGSTKVNSVLLNNSGQYKQQDFTITADAAGKWQSPMVEVKFYSNATDTKIKIFSSQSTADAYSKGGTTEYKTPGPIFVMTTGTINTFSIGSPKNNALVGDDGVITGTAKAGSTINVRVNSGYVSPNGGAPIAGAKQDLYTTAGSDGKWSVNANFNVITANYSKSTYQIVATVEGGGDKKEVTVIHPGNTSIETSSFRMTSPGANTTQMTDNGSIKIKGMAQPGSRIMIEQTYSGTRTSKYDAPGPGNVTNIVNVKNGNMGTLYATADVNGEWKVTTGMREVTAGVTSDDTNTRLATILIIKVSLIDGNGKKLKTETATFLNNFK